MKQVSIDHIEVTDQLIEINYWISQEKRVECVLFKTNEFEHWLTQQRQISLENYWVNWSPVNRGTYGHKIVRGDLENYFLHKMRALSVDALQDFSMAGKKPMTRVSQPKPSIKSSKTA